MMLRLNGLRRTTGLALLRMYSSHCIALVAVAITPFAWASERSRSSTNGSRIIFVCSPQNDLFQAASGAGDRFDSPDQAIRRARPNEAVLILADRYPTAGAQIDADSITAAKSKQLRLYVEYPDSLPGIDFEPSREVKWERAVVASTNIDLGLPWLSILSLHGCQFRPTTATEPALVLARVAGFKSAVFGLPEEQYPLLFKTTDGVLVATTKLSDFNRARFAPAADWLQLWTHILGALDPSGAPHRLDVKATVRPAYNSTEPLPAGAEKLALAHWANWLRTSKLLISRQSESVVHERLRNGSEELPSPAVGEPDGDGSRGILEGFVSHIGHDGDQPRRAVIRADCQAESAAVLALHASLTGDKQGREVAANLLDFLYIHSELHQGARADPNHPAYGLIAWGAIAPAWQAGNYGDDNARTLLATMIAGASLKSAKWDAAVMRALGANMRTTGKLGFRGDRIDVAELERHGWQHFHDREIVNYSPHFEAGLWACNLWAFGQTGDREFFDRTKNAIRMTMEAYPDGWRWGDTMERGRMLLPLAWLVRLEDTEEHREWLVRIVHDLLETQDSCGAISERLRGTGAGHYVVPASNEDYGTTETPLIQENGDPVTDQLYTSGFLLLGLHEAAVATGDPEIRLAANKLAQYLVRIQVRSEAIPYLNGTWFRAFDFKQWEYWASSADMGWGAWSAEAGWGSAWAAIAMGLRDQKTSFWDVADASTANQHWPEVKSVLER